MVGQDMTEPERPRIGSGWRLILHHSWPVVALVGSFALMHRWAGIALRLPEEAYQSPVIAAEIAVVLGSSLKGLVALVPLVALVVLRRSQLAARWRDFEGAREVRILVCFLAFWAAWVVATLDHNLFFDQSYNFDRLIIIVLAALTVWRPIFALPLVFLFVAVERQFDYPFGRQIFARTILENLLLLFSASMLLGSVTRRRETRSFVLVSLCLLASFYWYPGVIKLLRGWAVHGQLYLGGFASYANGWLASLPVENVENLLRLGQAVDWPARGLTLVSELLAPLFFLHRRVSRFLLISWVIVHIGIWVFSGVSFLVWIGVDLAFLFLWFRGPNSGLDLHSRGAVIGGVLLILLSPFWVRPPPVGWFDTRLVYTYRYEAIDASGKRAAFPAAATPLGEAWCARDFPFLSEQPTLLVRYGKTNDGALAGEIADLESAEEVRALEAARGRPHFDSAQARDFDRYLGEVAENWNRRRTARHALAWAAPPRTCLSPRSPPEPLIESGEAVRAIVVHQLTFLFDGQRFRQIRRVPVRRIEIPA